VERREPQEGEDSDAFDDDALDFVTTEGERFAEPRQNSTSSALTQTMSVG
jgi:hypothetical protein